MTQCPCTNCLSKRVTLLVQVVATHVLTGVDQPQWADFVDTYMDNFTMKTRNVAELIDVMHKAYVMYMPLHYGARAHDAKQLSHTFQPKHANLLWEFAPGYVETPA